MTHIKTDPARVELDGTNLKCHACSRDQFHRRRAHVQLALPTGMSPEWHENAAYCLVCDHCGYIHWFVQK